MRFSLRLKWSTPLVERRAAVVRVAAAQNHGHLAILRRPGSFDERERLMDPQTGSPQDNDQPPHPTAVMTVAAWRMTATISSTVGGSAGYRRRLFGGTRPM